MGGYIRFDIEDVCHLFGIRIEKGKIPCPDHLDNLGREDTHATNCVVYGDRYHCFACGGGGDAYSLAMKILGCDFITARNYLYKEFGYKLDKETIDRPFQTLTPRDLDFLRLNRNTMQKIYTESQALYNSIVLERIAELEKEINSAIQKSCSKTSELAMYVYDIANVDGEINSTLFEDLKNSFLKDLQILREIKEKVTFQQPFPFSYNYENNTINYLSFYI